MFTCLLCVMTWLAWPEAVPADGGMLLATLTTNASLAFSLALTFELVQWLRGRSRHTTSWALALTLAAVSFSWIVGSELTHAVAHFASLSYVHVFALSLAISCALSLYSLRADGFDRWTSRKLTLALNVALVVLLIWVQHRYRMKFREAKFAGVSAAFLLLTGMVCLRLVERIRPVASQARGVWLLGALLAVSLVGYAASPERSLRQMYFAGLYPGRILFAAHAPELFMRSAARSVLQARAADANTTVSSAVAARKTTNSRADIVLFIMVDALRADAFQRYVQAKDSKLHRAYTQSCLATTLYAPSSATSGSLSKLLAPFSQPDAWLEVIKRAGVKRSIIIDEKFAAAIDRARQKSLQTQFDRAVLIPRLPSGEVAPLRAAIQPLLHEAGPQLIWAHYFNVHEWDGGDPHASTALYHERVAEVGDEIASLIEFIEASLPTRRIGVVVTADHGEGLDHFSTRHHGEFVYEPLVRVPLMMWTHTGSCLEDTAPLREKVLSATVLGRLVLEKLGCDSEALFPSLQQLAARPILIQSTMQDAIIRWPHKLIVSPWFTELFDLAADPNEQHDLSQSSGPLVAELRELLEEETRER